MKYLFLPKCLFFAVFLSCSVQAQVTYSVGGFAPNGNMQSCAGSTSALTPLAACMQNFPDWDSYEVNPSGGIGNLTGDPADPIEEGVSIGPSCVMRSGNDRMVMQICSSIDIKKNIGDDCELPYHGNPINAATGNKFQKEVDYQSKSLDLEFTRFYNSQFGRVWGSSYSDYLWFNPINANHITYVRPDGNGIDFEKIGTTWTASPSIEQLIEASPGTWRLVNKRGQTLLFNSAGKLQSIEQRSGRLLSMSYSVSGTSTSIAPKSGLLISVTDSFGNSLGFTYNTNSLLSSMINPAGGVTTYGYDSLKRLISVTFPDQNAKSYIYGELDNTSNAVNPDLLTGIVDETGARISTYRYDAYGRAISTENAGGVNKFEFEYKPMGTDVNLPNGAVSELVFQNIQGKLKTVRKTQPAGSGCNASHKEMVIDSDGNISTSFDFNGVETTYTYESSRRLVTERVEAPGTSDARIFQTEWHPTFRSPLKVSSPNRKLSYTYDASGNVLTKTTQRTSDLTGVSGFAAEAIGAPRTITYTYNSFGQVLSIDEPRTDVNDTYTFTYSNGNLATITNPLGHVTSYAEYDGLGLPGAIIDPNGVRTNLTYSARGWLTGSSIGNPNNPLFFSSYYYDQAGRIVTIESSTGSLIEYSYDEAGRLIAVRDQHDNRTEYLLDASGNITQKTIIGNNDITQYREVMLYDNLSRIRQRIDSQDGISNYSYDANGNIKELTNAKGHPVNFTYNSRNLVEKITDPIGGETFYDYDGQDNLVAVVDPNGNTTLFERTGDGNVTSVLSPDTGSLVFTHDLAGNRITMIDARNVAVNYSYDALNRLTAVEYPSSPEEDVYYSYDAIGADNLGIGRLTGISTSDGAIEYRYNYQGLITKKITHIEGVPHITEYEYDSGGNLNSVVYPSGRRVNYELNSNGQILSINTSKDASQPLQTVMSNIQYQPFGPVSNYSLGNGLNLTHVYNQDYRLEHIHVSGLHPILDRTYNYDSTYNVTNIINNLDVSKSQYFAYDSLQRLTQAEGTYGLISYHYDAVGNRINQTHQSGADNFVDEYVYASGSSRLLEINRTLNMTPAASRSFAYDAAGSMISSTNELGEEQSYGYNKAYRMTEAQSNSIETARYTYNPLGQRTSKIRPDGTKEVYHYNELGSLIVVMDGSGNPLREYIYRDNHQVALITHGAVSASPISLDEGSASFQGNHVIASNQPGYTGAGFVDYIGEGQADWPLSISTSGSYDVSIRYALADANRPLALLVNGVEHTVLDFPRTSSWSAWSTVDTTLTLPAGNHILSLSTRGASGGNIDRIDITPLAINTEPEPINTSPIVLDETSASFQGNHVSASNQSGYTGTGFVDYVGEGQADWPLSVSSAGSYEVSIRYALAAANRPLALLLNGVEHTVLDFPRTSSWSTWNTVETTLTLPAGNHILSLSTTGVSGGNIDRIDIVPLATNTGVAPAPSAGIEPSLYFIHSDHLDTPQVITDQNQAVVWMADYQPFGKVVNEQSSELNLYSRFPGQYFDEETGLHYNYFRDYDPTIGRYIQSDPIGLQGGLNTYAYAFGNPLSWIDPLGLEVVGTWIIEPKISENWGFRRDRNSCNGKNVADCYWRGIDYGLGMEIHFWIEVMVSEGLIGCEDCDEWEVRTDDFYAAHDLTITMPAPGLMCGTVATVGRLQMTPYGCPAVAVTTFYTKFGAHKRAARVAAEEYLRTLTPEQRARLCKAGQR